MESEQTNTPSAAWPVLGMIERRLLGVLVEKAKTTPDAYPMSLNALTTGCNQKSNRDPVLTLNDGEVENTLEELQKKGLVSKIVGGRVERWRHLLYECWRADKIELAVLAELLLRGPQTEGELRGRASRMEPIDDLETLRGILRKLAERNLVVYLTPEGRRGAVLSHGFHDPVELATLRQAHADRAGAEAVPVRSSVSVTPPDAVATVRDQLNKALAEIEALRGELSENTTRLSRVEEEIRHLKQALGG
jgi:uncharacterized protein YceH (UPF0502 family)